MENIDKLPIPDIRETITLQTDTDKEAGKSDIKKYKYLDELLSKNFLDDLFSFPKK